MEKRARSLCLTLLFALQLSAQEADTLIRKLDSLRLETDSAGGQVNNISPAAYNEQTRMNVRTYFILLGSNFKQQVTKPFHMSGKDWKRFGAFAVVTGGLMLADEPIQRFGLRLRNSSQTVRDVSGFVTDFGGTYEGYTLAALGAYGFLFKNEKIKTTTLLATQSYITSGVLSGILKKAFGRQRPNQYSPDAVHAVPRFHGPFFQGRNSSGHRISGAFPSGHATAAFSAATVFAMEYRHRPLIPIISYSAATLIGLSRITENRHWATDILAGAALGYLTGRQVVNNYHRYAQLQNEKKKKNSLSFSLQYQQGVVMPGLVYTFR